MDGKKPAVKLRGCGMHLARLLTPPPKLLARIRGQFDACRTIDIHQPPRRSTSSLKGW